MVMVLGSLRPVNSSPILTATNASSSNSSEKKSQYLTRRRAIVFGPSVLVASLLNFNTLSSSSPPSFHLALAQQQQLDELQQEEDRAVQLFQEASPSVVFIKDLEIDKLIEHENAKVEGAGSGFIWDKFGHIVSIPL